MLRHPFKADSIHALAIKIVSGEYTEIPSKYSEDLKYLVDNLLHKDPEQRMNIDEIIDYLNLKFFTPQLEYEEIKCQENIEEQIPEEIEIEYDKSKLGEEETREETKKSSNNDPIEENKNDLSAIELETDGLRKETDLTDQQYELALKVGIDKIETNNIK